MNNYSIIVPIYNEEKNIENFFIECKNFIKENSLIDFELVIVDDGSDDKSKKLISEWSSNNKNINHNIISCVNNRGYGYALKEGISQSRYSNIIIIDCDGTYKFNDLQVLFQKFNDQSIDMVVGSRINNLKKNKFYYFNLKNLAREFIRLFACFMTNKKIIDINSGLRIFKKDKFEEVKDFLPNGFSFTSSITCLFFQKDLKIIYVDINYFSRWGKSKIKPVKDFFNFINLIVKLTIMIKPLRVFVPLFFLTFCLSLFFLILRILFTQNFFATGITLLIISLLFLFFGYVFEMLLIIYKKIKK